MPSLYVFTPFFVFPCIRHIFSKFVLFPLFLVVQVSPPYLSTFPPLFPTFFILPGMVSLRSPPPSLFRGRLLEVPSFCSPFRRSLLVVLLLLYLRFFFSSAIVSHRLFLGPPPPCPPPRPSFVPYSALFFFSPLGCPPVGQPIFPPSPPPSLFDGSLSRF